jgi:hypothetical protein
MSGHASDVKLKFEEAVPRRSVVLGEKLKVTQEWRPKTPLGLPMKLATQGTRLREIVGKAEEEGRSKSDVFEVRGKPQEEITDSRVEEAIKISRNFMEYYQDVQGKIKSIGEIGRALNAPENSRLEKFKREAGQVKQLLIEVGAYDEDKFEEAVPPLDATPLSSAGWVDGQERAQTFLAPSASGVPNVVRQMGYNPKTGNLYGGYRKRRGKSKKRKSKKRKSKKKKRTKKYRR